MAGVFYASQTYILIFVSAVSKVVPIWKLSRFPPTIKQILKVGVLIQWDAI